jgi:hypothetical protein
MSHRVGQLFRRAGKDVHSHFPTSGRGRFVELGARVERVFGPVIEFPAENEVLASEPIQHSGAFPVCHDCTLH